MNFLRISPKLSFEIFKHKFLTNNENNGTPYVTNTTLFNYEV